MDLAQDLPVVAVMPLDEIAERSYVNRSNDKCCLSSNWASASNLSHTSEARFDNQTRIFRFRETRWINLQSSSVTTAASTSDDGDSSRRSGTGSRWVFAWALRHRNRKPFAGPQGPAAGPGATNRFRPTRGRRGLPGALGGRWRARGGFRFEVRILRREFQRRER